MKNKHIHRIDNRGINRFTPKEREIKRYKDIDIKMPLYLIYTIYALKFKQVFILYVHEELSSIYRITTIKKWTRRSGHTVSSNSYVY